MTGHREAAVYQPALFGDVAHARATDPHTSHEAAASLAADKIRQSQADVLAVLVRLGQADDTALVREYTKAAEDRQVSVQSPSGIRTRRKELTKKGRVRDTGAIVVLESGRRAKVWTVAA